MSSINYLIMSLKREVLSFYKQIVKLSKNWTAIDSKNTMKEREYIINETKRIINENRDLTNDKEIRKLLEEGVNRMEIARHYRIPYPRPIYYPTGASLRKKSK